MIMEFKSSSTKQLNFSIDKILSNDISSGDKEKSLHNPSICSMSYLYSTNYSTYEFLPHYANVPFVQPCDTYAINHSRIASIANNFGNLAILGGNGNIVRPSPIRAVPKKPMTEPTPSNSHVGSNNNCRRRSWSRAVFSSLQRKGLEKRFAQQKYITKPDRRQLAESLLLTDAQVKVWFQNRRMKWRHTKENEKSGESRVNSTSNDTEQPSRSDSMQSGDDIRTSDDEDIDVGSNE